MNFFQHRIHIRKEYLKFSAAHLTIFPDGTHERLHGHNYSTQIDIHLREVHFEKMIPFSLIKEAIETICEEWDEKVLIAAQNPFLSIKSTHSNEVEFSIGKKRYVLPQEDTVLLQLDNITAETLASEGCRRLILALNGKLGFELMHSIEFRIEEAPGQGATCRWQSP